MDPDATLARWRKAKRSGDVDEARDAKEDLNEWLRRGGYGPKRMLKAKTRRRLRGGKRRR